MSKEDGGPAFPSLEVYESYNLERDRYEVQSDTATGMSLRDYFAAEAMKLGDELEHDGSFADLATKSYQVADAMLKARSR